MSLQNYSSFFVFRLFPYKLVVTAIWTIITFSMEQGYQQINVTKKMHLCERKIFAKKFSGWGTDRNILKISCHSRLSFVLHLLANRVIIMTIAWKVVELVSLFHHCSRVFRCSTGVPYSIVLCSGVPCFIVYNKKRAFYFGLLFLKTNLKVMICLKRNQRLKIFLKQNIKRHEQ